MPLSGREGGVEVPSSHKRSESRHKIILHLDSLREKAIKIAFVIAEGI